eukprot:6173857-Pleurochrysis_carterae.AAC.1
MDNASDNKYWTVMAFFAWMVAIGWVKEVTISTMAPGHTHVDIDELFKRIVERWKKLGHVLTPKAFSALNTSRKLFPMPSYTTSSTTFTTERLSSRTRSTTTSMASPTRASSSFANAMTAVSALPRAFG